MRYLCVIHDISDAWKITDTKEVDPSFFVGENLYIEVSKEHYDLVNSLMAENELVYRKEDMPFEVDKLIKNKLNSLDVAKYKTKNAIVNSLKLKFSELDQYAILKYMMLNIELSDKGFYLHAGNIEEKIIEIDKLNNTKLLKKAEDLSEVINYLDPKVDVFNKMDSLKKGIDLCRSIEQIKEKVNSADLS